MTELDPLAPTTSGSDRELNYTTSTGLQQSLRRDRDFVLEMQMALEACGMKRLEQSVLQIEQSLVRIESSLLREDRSEVPDLPPIPRPTSPSTLPMPLAIHKPPEPKARKGRILEAEPSSFSSDDDAKPARRRLSGSSHVSAGPSMAFEDFMTKHGRGPARMEDLESHRAVELLRGPRKRTLERQERKAQQMTQVRSQAEVVLVVPEPQKKKKASTLNSKVEPEMVGRRMSLEQLRSNTDAMMVERAKTPTSAKTPTRTSSSGVLIPPSGLPCLARILACLAGHMHFGEGLAARAFAFFSYFLCPFAMTCPIFLFIHLDVSAFLALCFFQIGISVASRSLERGGLGVLVGPVEYQLDELAIDNDFMEDWRKTSRRRFVETCIICVSMLTLRGSVYVWNASEAGSFTNITMSDTIYGLIFWSMLFRYLMLFYTILHCSSCLESALDSFGLRFFKEMDIEQALEEWNIVQATLRQVSGKLSDSLLVMGICFLASIALLAEEVVRDPNAIFSSTSGLVMWLSRFYPLILVFAYALIRAAAITEKANRVAPLVNSWKFSEDGEGSWMDYERQYAVQYISQSKAGFYVRGAQLTVPTVQKLIYYLGAVSFGLLSRLSAI